MVNNLTKRGRGRPKGAKDKVQRTVKENVFSVFEGLGGPEAMLAWAKDNQRDFYVSIYTKLLPKQVEGDIRHTHERLAQELTDDELALIVREGRAGTDSEKGGASKSTELH